MLASFPDHNSPKRATFPETLGYNSENKYIKLIIKKILKHKLLPLSYKH
jgi:hypothetical protein